MTVETRNSASKWLSPRLFLLLAGSVLAFVGGLGFLSYRGQFAGGGGRDPEPPRGGERQGDIRARAEAQLALLEEPRRRLPLRLSVVVLAVAGGLGFLAYRIWFAGGGGSELELVTETVGRSTIRASIVASGVVEPAERVVLRFPASGRVEETLVKLGQEVKKGDPLVRLEDDVLSNRLATAEANLTSAQIRLNVLLKGASIADLATAEQSVVSAEASLNRAQRALEDLLEGPTATDLAAAEQAVAAAEASLASAQVTYDQLTADASDAEVAAAESSVTAAEEALASAEIALENAHSNVDSAEATLRAAIVTYCADGDVSNDDPPCSPMVVPLSTATVADLLARLSDPETDCGLGLETVCTAINSLIQANASFLAATNAVETAQGTVASAEAALEAAEAKLNAVFEGPADEDVDAAWAAVLSAEEALRSAELKLEDLRQGPEPDEIAEAEDNVRQAQAALDAAVANRDDLLTGADPEDIELQRQQVHLAELSVEAARHDLEEATLTSPFDGTVAAINVQPGDLVGPSVDVLTLLTPNAMKVKLSVGETDLPSIRSGQTGMILFDAIQSKPFPIVVGAIDLVPTVQQGVVTYTVEAALLGLEREGPKPAPSMNGSAIVVTEQRADVLAVPNRAIRRRGDDVVVDVVVDGVAEPRVIKTGLADSEMTEVTEGLEEGELLVVGTRQGPSSEEDSSQSAPEPLPEGIR